MVELIDTHTHLYDSPFEEDFDEVVERAQQQGISKIILPAVDSTCHSEMLRCSDKLQGFAYPAIGLHPTSVKSNWREELDLVTSHINERGFCALGEIGIDGYWSKEYLAEQMIVLREQIELAVKNNLPMIIHMRDSIEEIFKVLDGCRHLSLRGVFHAWSGSIESYERLKGYGDFLFGIGGVVTYKNSKLPDVVAKMDLNDIVLETDSPWLTPVPYRGRRNEPSYIKIIAERIVQIKRISLEEVAEYTTRNATRMFNLN